MARKGGFGASLNPFGSGSLGGFSQYSLGDDLAALRRYEAEVAWANGQLSNGDYLRVLEEALAATSADSRERVAAQNKLDDARYRIGRQAAELAGPDALIDYDRAALATMRPDNLRYNDVKQVLASELAQRRSRDYGKLVEAFNAGTATIEKLAAWVSTTLAGLPEDAPDRDNWTQTAAELTRRAQDEADSKAYQDYQMGRMKPDAFLAYLTTRRDGFVPGSPQYDDWTRRLEDATKQVRDAKLATQDQTFFNAYNEGKKSDKEYLAYLKGRIGAMDADDPNRAEWEHRYRTAGFSLAEDQLRFDVQHGKAPVGRLVKFYEAYRATLNRGSAEWRSVTERLEAARKWKPAGGGGAGSAQTFGKDDPGKAISPRSNLDTIIHQVSITALSSKAAVANYGLNVDSLENAYKRGDKQWLFHDPANPGAVTQARDSMGNPVVGKDGKPVMVRGSFYVPVTSEAYSKLLGVKVDYESSVAEAALAKGRMKDYYTHASYAAEAQDRLRAADIHTAIRRLETELSAKEKEIEHFKVMGDKAAYLNAVQDALGIVAQIQSDPLLDESKRNSLEDKAERLADSPLVPKVDPVSGKLLPGPVDVAASARDPKTGKWTNVALAPGWHDVFSISPTTGERTIQQRFDNDPPGVWQSKHVTIHARYGEKVITADAAVTDGPITPLMVVHTPDGDMTVRGPASAKAVVYFDDEGQHTAYTLDGKSWITTDTGVLPMVEFNVRPSKSAKDEDGTVRWYDDKGTEVLVVAPDGGVKVPAGMESVTWFGQAAADAFPRDARGRGSYQAVLAGARGGIGAPGVAMTLTEMGANGLSLLPGTPPADLLRARRPRSLATDPRLAGERNDIFVQQRRRVVPRSLQTDARLRAEQREAEASMDSTARLLSQLPTEVGRRIADGLRLGPTATPPARLPALPLITGLTKLVESVLPPLPKAPAPLPPNLARAKAADLLPPAPKPPAVIQTGARAKPV